MFKMLEDLAKDWRPMWHEWSHPLRPWWRKAEDPFSRLAGMFGGSGASRPLENVWRRVDGQTVATCHPLDERGRPNERVVLGWAFLDPEAAKSGSAEAGRHPESGPFATAEEAMAYVDEHRPLPAPPPRVGQVWAWEDGEQHLVGRTTAVGGLVLLANGSLFTRDAWPPAGAFLVAGPTPWGRDVPWAPAAKITLFTVFPAGSSPDPCADCEAPASVTSPTGARYCDPCYDARLAKKELG